LTIATQKINQGGDGGGRGDVFELFILYDLFKDLFGLAIEYGISLKEGKTSPLSPPLAQVFCY
jgi:hypothetical protein